MDSIPELPGLWGLTPWGLLLGLAALILTSVIRGWWVPKPTHERELQQERQRGDEWKETALDQRAVNQEIRKQNGQLIEGQRVVEQFLRAAGPPFEDTQPKKGAFE